jgi:hypothetical protein
MQQLLPLLVLGRLSKALFVSRNAVPANEEKILALALEAPLKFV